MIRKNFVLDCSVAMTWFFADEISLKTMGILKQLAESDALVPTIWPYEVGNVLKCAVKSERITDTQLSSAKGLLAELPIQIDVLSTQHALCDSVAFAMQYDLTVYDASYLELAIRKGLPLATLDKSLNSAAKAAGVPCLLS